MELWLGNVNIGNIYIHDPFKGITGIEFSTIALWNYLVSTKLVPFRIDVSNTFKISNNIRSFQIISYLRNRIFSIHRLYFLINTPTYQIYRFERK